MKKYFFLLSFILLCLQGTRAQSSQRISGQVVDAQTGLPLEYAHVVISNTSKGTVTNAEGNFSLLVPVELTDRSIIFSFIGYSNSTRSIQSIMDSGMIRLSPTSVNLPELIVSRKKESIMEEAIAAIPENHDLDDMVLSGFWRAWISSEQGIIQLSETAFDIFRYGREKQRAEKKNTALKILRGRISRDSTAFEELSNFQAGTTPEGIFAASYLLDNSFLSRKTLKKHNYRISDITSFEGRNVYVIEFDIKPGTDQGYRGSILLDVETLAFVRIAYGFSPKNEGDIMLFDGAKIFARLVGLSKSTWDANYRELNFKRYQGKWYLSHGSYTADWTLINDRKGLEENINYRADLVITDINKGAFQIPDKDETARDKILENQVDYSGGDFWRDYNYLEPDQDFEQVFKDIRERNERRKVKE